MVLCEILIIDFFGKYDIEKDNREGEIDVLYLGFFFSDVIVK